MGATLENRVNEELIAFLKVSPSDGLTVIAETNDQSRVTAPVRRWTVNKCAFQLAILLVLTSAAATQALQEGIPPQTDKANTVLAWSALMSSMAKMQVAMESVESSGSSDTDFVRLMLPHHRAAIEMAKTQLLFGKDLQMRRLAQEIIADQQSEIELMQLWQKQHRPDSQRTDQMPSGHE
jgi:Domain of unknown function (DUF305)